MSQLFTKSLTLQRWSITLLMVTLIMVTITGCQTQRQATSVQRGMTMSEVRSVFGEPDEVESGSTNGSEVVMNWYYYAYTTQRYLEWVYIPGSREYGGTYQQVPTSRGVRYRKFRIVFLEGVVISSMELAPPEL